jgi:ActR/RegA family two-component response regulator
MNRLFVESGAECRSILDRDSHVTRFAFRKPDRERQDSRPIGMLGTLVARIRFLGDWNITLRMLSCRKREVLETARRMHRRSIARQIAARNPAADQEWSGKL